MVEDRSEMVPPLKVFVVVDEATTCKLFGAEMNNVVWSHLLHESTRFYTANENVVALSFWSLNGLRTVYGGRSFCI